MSLILSGTDGLSDVDGSAATPAIRGTDANTGMFFPAADTIAFSEGGVESMRIDSAGNLLIGTSTLRTGFFNGSNPTLVQIEGLGYAGSSQSIVRNGNDANGPFYILGKTRATSLGGTTVVNSGDNLGVISFQGSDGTELVEGARIFAEVSPSPGANDMPASLVFSTTADGASTSTERMRILSTGNILCLSGGSTTANGTGIAFPATQSASSDANTLDDYEEGTWNPDVNFAGGSTGLTYTSRQGQYVKIGRQVTAWFFVQLSNKGSSTGLARIGGFPFSAANPVAEYAVPIYLYSGFTSVTSSTGIAYMDNVSIFEIRPASGTGNLSDANFTNTSWFWGTVTYQV